MKRLFHLLGFTLLTWAGSTLHACADAKTYALIVGVGEYQDEQIHDRPSAVADARALYELLIDERFLGVPKDQISLLLSGSEGQPQGTPATRENILQAVDKVVKQANQEDFLIVAMFGQGASAADSTCFFPSDAVFKDRVKTSILPKELGERIKPLKTDQLLALLDIHFKGFDAGEETVLEPNLIDLIRVFYAHEEEELKNDDPAPLGRAVILGNAGLVSNVQGDRGIFSKVVMDALRGQADTDGGPDGNVTVDELIRHLETKVPDLARKVGKTRDEKEQLPFVEFARTSHFIITHNPDVYAQVQKQLKQLAELRERDQIDEGEFVEGKRLLGRMPKLKAFRELRAKYEDLIKGEMELEAFREQRKAILTALKISPEEAELYARKVLLGVDSVSEAFIKKIDITVTVAESVRGLFRRIEAVVPKDLAERLDEAKDLSEKDLRTLLADARVYLGRREDLDEGKDVDITLKALMSSLKDPYTTYIDAKEFERLKSQIQGEFTGIGIQIRRDLVRDGLLVVTPIKGSPAYKAGLKAGDLITEIIRPVDNEGTPIKPPEVLTTKGMKTDEAVKKILGKEGTPVQIKVVREGEDKPLVIDLNRAPVEVESVLGWERRVDDSWSYFLDEERGIGYIYLTQFTKSSDEDMKKAIEALKKKGLKGLILDLRFNPGGYLDTAVEICDLFVEDGMIVKVKPRVGFERPFFGEIQGSETDFPMVVLINEGSASGSEIVAACLQDHGRAVVMGNRSFGKGSVQNMQGFPITGGILKLTTATFWRPSDKNLNKASTEGKEEEDWGVRPSKGYKLKLSPTEMVQLRDKLRDHEIIPRRDLPEKEAETQAFTDRQLDMALEYLSEQIRLASTARRNN